MSVAGLCRVVLSWWPQAGSVALAEVGLVGRVSPFLLVLPCVSVPPQHLLAFQPSEPCFMSVFHGSLCSAAGWVCSSVSKVRGSQEEQITGQNCPLSVPALRLVM